MALIRQANAATAARDAIVLDLGDLMRQGEVVKARAREAAERIMSEARKERDRLIAGAAEQGRREGLDAGRAEGLAAGADEGRRTALADAKERLAKLDEVWTAALATLERDRDSMLLQAREDVLKLAIALGEAVTKRAIVVQPEVVQDQLRAVLEQIARPTRLTIRIHPDDRAFVELALPRLIGTVGAAQHAELVDDEKLDRGSVIAGTAAGGEVDGSIATQLERIAESLVPGGKPPPGARS